MFFSHTSSSCQVEILYNRQRPDKRHRLALTHGWQADLVARFEHKTCPSKMSQLHWSTWNQRNIIIYVGWFPLPLAIRHLCWGCFLVPRRHHFPSLNAGKNTEESCRWYDRKISKGIPWVARPKNFQPSKSSCWVPSGLQPTEIQGEHAWLYTNTNSRTRRYTRTHRYIYIYIYTVLYNYILCGYNIYIYVCGCVCVCI